MGLCEMVQHIAFLDAAAIAGEDPRRRIEFVDHLHEHFEVPVRIERGAYMPPEEPGGGARMHEASVRDHLFPDGPVWREILADGERAATAPAATAPAAP